MVVSDQASLFISGIKFQEFNISPKARRVSYEESVDHFMERVNLIQRLKISATRDFGTSDSAAERFDVLQFSSREMLSIVVATLYPLFLQSQEYETAVNMISEDSDQPMPQSQQHSNSNDLVVEDLDGSFKSRQSFSRISALTSALSTRLMSFRGGGGNGKGLRRSFSALSGSTKNSAEYKRIQYLYLDELENTSAEELEPLLRSGAWTADFLAAMDEMKMSLTIATAPQETKQDYKPSALVYLNTAFETLTQHSRLDLLGGTCRVLQSKCTEKEQIGVMRQCVEQGEACKVAVCNVRKNNTEFVNFVALMPFYTTHNEYKYMIGLQYDASDGDASLRDIKMIDDYLMLVNNLLR